MDPKYSNVNADHWVYANKTPVGENKNKRGGCVKEAYCPDFSSSWNPEYLDKRLDFYESNISVFS